MDLVFYPNPLVSGDVVFFNPLSSDGQIKIYGLDGRLLHSGRIKSSTAYYRMPPLPAGIVVIELMTQNACVVQELVISE